MMKMMALAMVEQKAEFCGVSSSSDYYMLMMVVVAVQVVVVKDSKIAVWSSSFSSV